MDMLQQDIIAETYVQMEGLLKKVVGAFVRRYKFANFYDEYVGEATLAFIKAFNDYDGSIELEHWISFKVWHRLKDINKTRAKNHRLLPRAYVELDSLQRLPTTRDFDLDHFKQELSFDARLVVEVLFDQIDQPEHCQRLARSRPHALKMYLKEMGWPKDRVAKAFDEISQALETRNAEFNPEAEEATV